MPEESAKGMVKAVRILKTGLIGDNVIYTEGDIERKPCEKIQKVANKKADTRAEWIEVPEEENPKEPESKGHTV